MESHEENLHNMIKISKMETAKDLASAAAARLIRDRRAQQQRTGVPTGMGGGGGDGNDMQLGLSTHSCQYQYHALIVDYISSAIYDVTYSSTAITIY